MKRDNTRTDRKTLIAGLLAAAMITSASASTRAAEPVPLYQEPSAGAPASGYGYRQSAWAPERSATVIDGTVLDHVGDFIDRLFNVRNLDAERDRDAQEEQWRSTWHAGLR